jgi:N-acetyl sugar amidotransferase
MSQECVNCLYTSDHPFGLTFNEDGLCSGCVTHQEKFDLDWDHRFELLLRKVEPFRSKSGQAQYDCVVPVRGTPEYFYVLDVVKNRLGLNPLVVMYNSQFNSIPGIRNLDLLRESFDVDLLHYTSNPVIYKKLIRESLVKLNSMRWPYLAGETQFPVQVAVEHNIPLIIWPLHQPTEQVGMHSYEEEPEMTRRGRHEFDLMGHEPADFVNVETLANRLDVEDLHYPDNRRLSKTGVTGIYLSNYIPWDSRTFSEEMVGKFGAVAAGNPRTFDTYDRIDDMTYMTIHDILKQAKLGYSRVTDNLCREIRFNRVSKKDSRVIEAHYQALIPEREIAVFLEWIGMIRKGLGWYLEYLNYKIDFDAVATPLNAAQQSFVSSFSQSEKVFTGRDYIIFGKGLNL